MSFYDGETQFSCSVSVGMVSGGIAIDTVDDTPILVFIPIGCMWVW